MEVVVMGVAHLSVPCGWAPCGSTQKLVGIVAVTVWCHQHTIPRWGEILTHGEIPMHAHTVQRGRTDFLQSSSTHCQVVGSGGRGGHLGRHNPAALNTGFRRLADGTPASAASTIHAEHSLLLVLLLLLLFLPKDIVHAISIHTVLHSLCVLCRQPRACVHHISLGTHSYHIASSGGA